MQRALTVPSVDTDARAWRLRFLDAPPAARTPLGEAQLITVLEPRTVYVVAEPAAAEGPPETIQDGAGRSLAVLWMPPRAREGADSAWVEGIPLEGIRKGGRVIRAGLRTSRVVWTDSVAVIYAAPDQLEDARDAVIRFTVLERDTAEIEAGMPGVWSSIHRNVALTHTVNPRELRHHGSFVGHMTEQVTQMNSRALHNDTALEQLDPALSPGSKRLFAELALQAGLYDRLEALGEPLDFAFDYHELLNNRLIEASQWSRSTRIELWILAVLCIDLLLSLYPVLASFLEPN